MNKEKHIQLLLNSYEKLLNKKLIERVDPKFDLKTINDADFIVVSHGAQLDPIFNYANKLALKLWEMDIETFVSLPSKYSAEPTERKIREKLLLATKSKGYYDQYKGVRVSSTGKRFEISNVTVWNLYDEHNHYYGQAATFRDIKKL